MEQWGCWDCWDDRRDKGNRGDRGFKGFKDSKGLNDPKATNGKKTANPPVSLPYDRGDREGWSYLRSAASPSRRFGGVVEQKVAARPPLQGAFGHSECMGQRHSTYIKTYSHDWQHHKKNSKPPLQKGGLGDR